MQLFDLGVGLDERKLCMFNIRQFQKKHIFISFFKMLMSSINAKIFKDLHIGYTYVQQEKNIEIEIIIFISWVRDGYFEMCFKYFVHFCNSSQSIIANLTSFTS